MKELDHILDDIFNAVNRSMVGFDALRTPFRAAYDYNPSYPRWNTMKVDDGHYVVAVGVPGKDADDLDVSVQGDVLTIATKTQEANQDQRDDDFEFLHRGLATRSFRLRIQLFPHMEVDKATVKNGILYVGLIRDIPEEEKPRQIPVSEDDSFLKLAYDKGKEVV